MADLKLFTFKKKLVIYIEAFVEFYNKKNRRQVHKIYKIIKFIKIYALIIENSHNFGTHLIIKYYQFYILFS